MSKNIGLSCNGVAITCSIYLLASSSATILYAIHCIKEFHMKYFIASLILIQFIALLIIFNESHKHYQQGKTKCDEVKKIDEQHKKKSLYKNKSIFAALSSAAFITQMVSVACDTIFSILYFTYEKIKTWHYVLITVSCAAIGIIASLVGEYLYGNKEEEAKKLINLRARKIDKGIKHDVTTKTSFSLGKVGIIYLLTAGVPAIISALHAAYTLKVSIIISFIVIAQLIGAILMITDLYAYKQAGEELNNYLKKVDTKERYKDDYDCHIKNKKFAGIVAVVIFAQVIAGAVDTIMSRLYFTYELVTTMQYALTIIGCSLVGLMISMAYEYVYGIKEDIAELVTNVQVDTLSRMNTGVCTNSLKQL